MTGLGDRVEKSSGTLYWYGKDGEVLEETSLTGALTNDYVFFGNGRVAQRTSSAAIYYYFGDHLGTSRVMTTSAGAVCYSADFYPFGGERVFTDTCAQNYKFTGKERDTETGNDNFGARYYTSSFGRFESADWSATPEAVPYANLSNPQTLNLYQYTADNPETFADLDGHFSLIQGPMTSGGPAPALEGGGCDICSGTGDGDLFDSVNSTEATTTLTSASEEAILNSNLTGPQAIAFEDAVLNAAQKTGIDPNVLVGIAMQESSLGKFMNGSGGKGLFGIEEGKNGDLAQINKMFGSGITHADLLSLDAPSMNKVSLGVAQFLQHYATLYSNSTDPRGIDVALSVWRVGIGQTQANIRAGNFWDYVDPVLNESVQHYVDKVEEYQ